MESNVAVTGGKSTFLCQQNYCLDKVAQYLGSLLIMEIT